MYRWKGFAVLVLLFSASLAGCIDRTDVMPTDEAESQSGLRAHHVNYCCLYQLTTPVTFIDDTLPTKFKFEIPLEENVTGIIFELVWHADNPVQEEMILQIVGEDWGNLNPSSPVESQEPLRSISGLSPLHIAIPIEDFTDPPYFAEARAHGTGIGVGYHQQFTVTFTPFVNVPFDPEWSFY